MRGTTIQSDAFRIATLRSERIRVVTLLAFLLVMVVVMILRALLTGRPEVAAMLPSAAALLVAASVYEGVLLWRLHRALAAGRSVPEWVWVGNVVVELLVPTLGIWVLARTDFIGPYRALTGAPTFAYFIFIILATLRLRPGLCLFTGVMASAQFAGMLIWTYLAHPAGDPAMQPLPMYVSIALLLVLAGGVAAAVARQIRGHVEAALREVETRREVERMQRDLSIARSIQQGLLPAGAPLLGEFEIAGWNRPADETGGDYYDWQQLPDGRIAISLADVTGHGIGPALVTAVCRAYSRASFPTGASVGALMDRINDLLVEDLPPERFVTFAVVVLDPETARAEVLSAGHGPLLLYRAADDRVESWAAHGLPLGIMSGVEYGTAQQIDFAPGDRLVLITDGFFEWADEDGEQFGIERLKEVIRQHHALSPTELIRMLHERVQGFVGASVQDDDLTAVVIARAGDEQ